MPREKWPEWVESFKGQYLAGSASFFILHGNVDDAFGRPETDEYVLETLADYLAARLFGSYDLVLHYDHGRGLRPHTGGDPERLTKMNGLLERLLGGGPELLSSDPGPTRALRMVDRLVTMLLVSSADGPRRKSAFLFDYGELICPPGHREAEHLALFLDWARSPVIKRVNMVFILMARSLAEVNAALIQSAHTAEILVPMPDAEERRMFIEQRFPDLDADTASLAELSAGLTLSNLDNMLRLKQRLEHSATDSDSTRGRKEEDRDIASDDSSILNLETDSEHSDGKGRVPAKPGARSRQMLNRIKKNLIESQCPGLIEFVEPKYTLDLVAGHTVAKKRLAEDAALVRSGFPEAVPMGYLVCGPVGVGKTFIAMCYAGTVGIPCVAIRNFRSKYVGETEANLERILGVLRELGPVAVIIDEADAAVGNRGSTGDSGTSSRVFAQLAAQMGDTRYRGRLIWFLLTCRPDLLPVDLKRQGRCEEHIPLFYPETSLELHDMFMAMAHKLELDLEQGDIPDLGGRPPMSGADIESLLTRVRRESILRRRKPDLDLLTECLGDFQSQRGPEHELQMMAATLECSDLRYLPANIRRTVEGEGGHENLVRRFRALQTRFG